MSVIDFFTDDLPSAGMVIVWSIALGLLSHSGVSPSVCAPIFLLGIIGILVYSTWGKSKKLSGK